jgi:hypothetical protein
MSGEIQKNEGEITFGPKRLEPVPFLAINELQQVRTTYAPASIDELASSIQTDQGGSIASSRTFELANPLLVGFHTQASAKKYISEHGDYYRIPKKERFDYQNLTPLNDETAVILIAGHRRRRAIGRLLEMNNIQPAEARIQSSVHDNIEFNEAIGLQLRENVYERPLPQDEARAIDLLYRHSMMQHGTRPSIRQLAGQIGFSETKVREALTYASLPESIQAYTEDGVLSYSVVRQLAPLYDAFTALYKEDSAIERLHKAELSVQEFCNITLSRLLSGRSDEKISKAIANRVKEIQGQAQYQQATLDFLIETDDLPHRTRRTERQLGATALAVVGHQMHTGVLHSSEVERLETLLAEYRANEARKAAYRPTELELGLAEAS